MEVLQTSPLATWVRRRVFVPYPVLPAHFNNLQRKVHKVGRTGVPVYSDSGHCLPKEGKPCRHWIRCVSLTSPPLRPDHRAQNSWPFWGRTLSKSIRRTSANQVGRSSPTPRASTP